jgi:hypothetical protein
MITHVFRHNDVSDHEDVHQIGLGIGNISWHTFRHYAESETMHLVRSLDDLGDDYGTCFIPIRRDASISSNFVRGLRIIDRALGILDRAVES